MYFYKVWVRSARYHGEEALTYSSTEKCQVGTLVSAPLQKQTVLGVVIGGCSEPDFKTKPLELLIKTPLPLELINLAEWLRRFYPCSVGAATQLLLPAHFSKKSLDINFDGPANPPVTSSLPSLTNDQKVALQQITKPDTYLVHGRTGSGKTRLYIELALRSLTANGSAIILTPEISLTSQLARSFAEVFGDRVVVLHSNLSPAERQRIWLRILKTSSPLIVVGPRSALFAPLRKVGLIVIDESHEAAYKQEQAPYYHATRAASQLAKLHEAWLILGSATPSITDFFLAEQKRKPIIKLHQIPGGHNHRPTEIELIDARRREHFSRSSHFSDTLLESINQALDKREQTLLYLNRRGSARLVLCEKCGWQAVCPHCDLPLTYHGDTHLLQCHTCGFKQPPPGACPDCRHPSVLFKVAGTKSLVEEARRLFPHAKIQRFDTDNTKAERFEQNYEAVLKGEVDIIIGTQLLAKGLDLPKLSTVGVVLADTGLYLPDFSSTERTYQLLKQVVGRVGRGHIAGTAVIQTYNPNEPVLKAVLDDDWQDFYTSELTERKKYLFPPYCHLLQLTCHRASRSAAETTARDFKKLLNKKFPGLVVEGPAPSFHEKNLNKFNWQLVVKSPRRDLLTTIIQDLPASSWSYNIDPINLL